MNKRVPLLMGAAALAGLGFGYTQHDQIKRHVGYGSYLIPHKWYVGKGMRAMDLPWGQTLKHDLSKFRPTEWSAYSEYFNGPTGVQGTNDRKTHEIWRKAVREHYDRNPHHWRALGYTPEQVPMEYKLEALADWYGVQRAKGSTKKDFKQWFEERKQTFPIDKATIMEAEQRLKTAAKENKYTSLEYTIASGDPFVKALTRNMPADKQKAVWRRYAQIVLRNRNYGRQGRVAGEYIKTKEPGVK